MIVSNGVPGKSQMSRSSKRSGRGRRGNKEDDFGIDDAHWDVYRVIVCARLAALIPR
jgi:hypothetical protein